MRLSRAKVLSRALELLDEVGLDALTMRGLATSLGVRVGGLYWHFDDKQALLDAMAEEILSTVDLPDPALEWRERLRALAGALREALRSRRDGAQLVAGTFVTQPHTLRAGRALTSTVLDAGIAPERASTLAFALFYYVLGHTIEEQARDSLPESSFEALLTQAEAGHAPEEADTSLRSMYAVDAGRRFLTGLDVFLDGLAVDAARTPPGAQGR
ncbi:MULTISPECIES: TetR/AcrR family transcriptional regulator C-terminal domain-containing protein [unclassified Streptomyces]|uniref:TetR/AcrR family transcriptional regulator C-terminal domain-containing protein n=1 Tax=unclassified Streptomyces TaxID=2593676 RepID=UPI003828DE19